MCICTKLINLIIWADWIGFENTCYSNSNYLEIILNIFSCFDLFRQALTLSNDKMTLDRLRFYINRHDELNSDFPGCFYFRQMSLVNELMFNQREVLKHILC